MEDNQTSFLQAVTLQQQFPIGSEVEITERYSADEWYCGEILNVDRINVSQGVIEGHDTRTGQVHVRLTGGYLFNNPHYSPPTVWHTIEQPGRYTTKLLG